MTATTLDGAPATATGRAAPGPARVVLALARLEARHLLRHPVTLLGVLLLVANAADTLRHGADVAPRAGFDAITTLASFFPGVLMLLVAHLVATRDHRAGADELLAAVPARPAQRVAGLCVASLAPAVVALAVGVVLWVALTAQGVWVEAPQVWHVLQAPVTVVGAGLLGTMLGVWAPYRPTGVVALVLMVAANFWLNESGETGRLFGPMVTWAAWGPYDDGLWAGLVPGDPAAHLGYLVGLCAMAAAGALVRVADRRTPPVLLGVAGLALAVAGGIGQRP